MLLLLMFEMLDMMTLHHIYNLMPKFPVDANTNILRIQVKFVNPLIRSQIVGDAAYETLVKLSQCIAPPLSNWALDIATALRLVEVSESHVVLDLISATDVEEAKEKPALGLLNRVVIGLTVSCKYGPLPVDTYLFVFPVNFYCSE